MIAIGFGSVLFLILTTTVVMMETNKITDHLDRNVGASKKLALLLDYDGTLTPIARRPEMALIPEETKNILERISRCRDVFVAIISGRQADDVKRMVGIDGIIYAGSHGFEIININGTRYHHTVPEKEKEKLLNVENALKKITRDGTWVENKGDVLTYHYRETPNEKRDEVIKEAKDVIMGFGLKPSDAVCAVEIQPAVNWNKGYAAEYLLESKYGKQWIDQVKVIFAGDDVSDEKLIEMFKGKASTFRISTSEDVRTSASMVLKSTEDVKVVLKWIERNYRKDTV